MEQDFIIGIHSIICAIKNPNRYGHRLFASNEGIKQLQKKIGKINIPITRLSPHDLQSEAKKQFRQLQVQYRRISTQMFLLVDKLPVFPPEKLFKKIEQGEKLRLIALDGVTDLGNAAAITRTAAFFAVDALLSSVRGSFGKGPWFFRTASGAMESVQIIHLASLSKALAKLQKMGVYCLGLDENAENSTLKIPKDSPICLVMGAEDKGLSHGVKRILTHQIALIGQGVEQSLNVSVAAAICMERIWGKGD